LKWVSAWKIGVDRRAGVDVGAAVEEEAGGVEKAVLGGHVE
jgi:hypothetical protein